MTPSLFDLPIRPPEAAKLAVLVLEQAGELSMTDELRSRIAARSALLKLRELRPHFASLERDPIHSGAIYAMVDNGEGRGFLLRMAPNATPSSGLFPKSILIGRMPGPKGMEIVVNASPFELTNHEAVTAYAEKVNTAFRPRPRGGHSAIVVESNSPETVLPAAFEAFRVVLRERGLNLAGAADAVAGAWAAIRTGWREGYTTETKDAVTLAQLTVKQRASCILEIDRPDEAAQRIAECSSYLL